MLIDFYESHVNPSHKVRQKDRDKDDKLQPIEARLKRRHNNIRVELAIYRILAPLLESAASGFVELHWRELSARELKSFVRAGLDRERLLLERVVDPQRAQEVAGLNAKQFMSRFGPENMAPLQKFRKPG